MIKEQLSMAPLPAFEYNLIELLQQIFGMLV